MELIRGDGKPASTAGVLWSTRCRGRRGALRWVSGDPRMKPGSGSGVPLAVSVVTARCPPRGREQAGRAMRCSRWRSTCPRRIGRRAGPVERWIWSSRRPRARCAAAVQIQPTTSRTFASRPVGAELEVSVRWADSRAPSRSGARSRAHARAPGHAPDAPVVVPSARPIVSATRRRGPRGVRRGCPAARIGEAREPRLRVPARHSLTVMIATPSSRRCRRSGLPRPSGARSGPVTARCSLVRHAPRQRGRLVASPTINAGAGG